MTESDNDLNAICRTCGDISPRGSKTCMCCGASMNGAGSDNQGTVVAAFGYKFDPTKVAIIITGLSVLYMLCFIAPLDPIRLPFSRLFALGVISSLVTAILVYIDCVQMDLSSRVPGTLALSPLRWFFFVLFAWPVGFPLYFLVRSRLCESRKSHVAYVATGMFVVTFLVLCTVLAERCDQFRGTDRVVGTQMIVNGQPIEFNANSTPMLIAGDKSTTGMPNQIFDGPQ